MKNRISTIISCLFILIPCQFIQSQTTSPPINGNGTMENPYEISSLENLLWLSLTDTVYDKFFIQTLDIDATVTNTWFVGDHDNDVNTPDVAMGFDPIGIDGYSPVSFTGSYNGNGHRIKGLFVNRPSDRFGGLFGSIYNASIENIGLDEVNITGGDEVGGLVGFCSGNSVIKSSYVKGTVVGKSVGLIGGSVQYTEIYDSYCIGFVDGSSGGMIESKTYGSTVFITNSYSAVQALNAGYTGLSDIYDLNLNSSFYNASIAIDTWKRPNGKTTSELKEICTYLEAGWDFVTETKNGTEDHWAINPDINDGYPFLAWEGYINTGSFNNCCYYPEFVIEGDGSSNNPYQISNACHLKWLSTTDSVFNKHFIQTANIDLKDSKNWNYGDHDSDESTMFEPMGFKPIGYTYKPNNNNTTYVEFKGVYNGQGYIIDSIFINRPGQSGVGFFGVVQYANISNVGLKNAEIIGGTSSGILAGDITNTTINNCFTGGNIQGVSEYGGMVGGLVGYSKWNSSIYRSYSEANVKSLLDDVGGLVGIFSGDTINESYSTGIVEGRYSVGGFIGMFDGEYISNSYSQTTINSVDGGSIGGFVGWGHTGEIKKCYSSSVINYTGEPNSFVKGFVGNVVETSWDDCMYDSTLAGLSNQWHALSTEEMQNSCNYTNSGWDFISETDNGTIDIWGINSTVNNGYPFLAWQGYSHNSAENCNTTGISEAIKKNYFSVYPNPAKEYFYINLEGFENKSIANIKLFLCDNLGRSFEIETVALSSNRFFVCLNDLKGGMYYLSLYDAHNLMQTSKIYIDK